MSVPSRKASSITLQGEGDNPNTQTRTPPSADSSPDTMPSPNYRFPPIPTLSTSPHDTIQPILECGSVSPMSPEYPPMDFPSPLPTTPSSAGSMAIEPALTQKVGKYLRVEQDAKEPSALPPPRKGSAATLTTDTASSYNRSGEPMAKTISSQFVDYSSVATRKAGKYVGAEVDLTVVNSVCVYMCFIAGFTNAISFSACYVWAGFQSANVANLGLALARNFNPAPFRTTSFQIGDQQLLISLIFFCVGTFLGRIGEKIGSTRRVWLVGATFFQVLLTVAGTLCVHFSEEPGIARDRGDPSWSDPAGMIALALISAAMGLQGIIGKRLGSPMNSTVVLTTTWVELFNDPFLFAFRYAPSRDIRILGILAVFIGAFCSTGLIGTACGITGTMGVMIGLRAIQMGWFMFLKQKKSELEGSDSQVVSPV